MTREEAIQELTHELRVWESECKSVHPTKDALRLAIEALQFAKHFDLLKEYQSLQEVVYCKDCKHLEVINTENTYAICNEHDIIFEPFEDDTRTHFCSWGERREE